jgi:hypothetical protein
MMNPGLIMMMTERYHHEIAALRFMTGLDQPAPRAVTSAWVLSANWLNDAIEFL